MLRELVDARRPFRGVARSDAKRMRGKRYKSGKAGKRGVAEGKRRDQEPEGVGSRQYQLVAAATCLEDSAGSGQMSVVR